MKLDSNAEKSHQLGIPHGTAQHKLRMQIMFALVQRCDLDICYQCGKKIHNLDELSIEHKIPWLHSESPKELFFDMENISFSHRKCNRAARRKNQYTTPCPSYAAYQRGCRCESCKEYKRRMTRESNRRTRSNGVLI